MPEPLALLSGAFLSSCEQCACVRVCVAVSRGQEQAKVEEEDDDEETAGFEGVATKAPYLYKHDHTSTNMATRHACMLYTPKPTSTHTHTCILVFLTHACQAISIPACPRGASSPAPWVCCTAPEWWCRRCGGSAGCWRARAVCESGRAGRASGGGGGVSGCKYARVDTKSGVCVAGICVERHDRLCQCWCHGH